MRYENSKMNFAFEEQPVFVKGYLPVVIKNFKQKFLIQESSYLKVFSYNLTLE